MGRNSVLDGEDTEEGEDIVLRVDDRGRVTIPKSVRDRLGIEPGTDVPARLHGSVLTVDPSPSSKIETATTGRDDWEESTPTDAGESLFGSMDGEDR